MLSPYSFRIVALPLGGSVRLEFIWATGLSKASILQLLREDTQLAQLCARRTILPPPSGRDARLQNQLTGRVQRSFRTLPAPELPLSLCPHHTVTTVAL